MRIALKNLWYDAKSASQKNSASNTAPIVFRAIMFQCVAKPLYKWSRSTRRHSNVWRSTAVPPTACVTAAAAEAAEAPAAEAAPAAPAVCRRRRRRSSSSWQKTLQQMLSRQVASRANVLAPEGMTARVCFQDRARAIE